MRATVTKLRNLSFAIINSTTLALPVWRRICKAYKLKSKLMPRDVVTRWDSTYDLLLFALRYRAAIDTITADKKLKLRKYELYDIDWAIVDDLAAVLEQYKKATLYFSSDSASICAVIPAMDRIDNKLNVHTNKPFHPAIVSAMKLARLKLNRYYSLTNLSSIYQIAMGVYLTNLDCSIADTFTSSSSRPQARVLSKARMGSRLDADHRGPGPKGVHSAL